MRQTLTALLATEQNPTCARRDRYGVATLNLDSTEPAERLAAIEHVGGVVNSLVRTKMAAARRPTKASTRRREPPRAER